TTALSTSAARAAFAASTPLAPGAAVSVTANLQAPNSLCKRRIAGPLSRRRRRRGRRRRTRAR
ncbi:MAG: hypothetical protein AAGN82_28465, partial [Myxococcota bacterium]